MPLTKDELITKAQEEHDYLTKRYYSGETGLLKHQFDEVHAKIWTDLHNALVAGGFLGQPKETFEAEVKRRLNALESAP